MADFKTSDYKTYEQSMWQEPKASNQSLWHEPAERYGSIPEPLYRLRLSVLKDDQGANDCPARTFVSSTPIECKPKMPRQFYDSTPLTHALRSTQR